MAIFEPLNEQVMPETRATVHSLRGGQDWGSELMVLFWPMFGQRILWRIR
jgi:hypothetical protein